MQQGDEEMSRLRLEALRGMQVVRITDAAEQMAAAFIETKALPATMRADALHLALAAVSGADYLMTWNCRHLANANVLKRLREEGVRRGWRLPLVCTPLELIGDSL